MSEFDDRQPAVVSREALSYPLNAFPPLVRDAIAEIHADSNIALEILGAAALGAMSLVCQRTTDVRVQANDSPIPCGLFLLTIAEPDSGKSYATKFFNEAPQVFEAQISDRANNQNATLSGRLAAWKITEKKLSKELGRAEEGTEEFDKLSAKLIEHHRMMPVKLLHKQLIFSKATSAGVREMLLENDRAIGLIAPDAGSVVNGPAFGDMPLLSGLWSGEDVRDGLASGSPPLKEPRLTLSLMLQDSEFQKFMRRRRGDASGNGLLSRFLTARSSISITTENNFPKEKIHLFRDHLLRLLTDGSGKNEREVLDFSEQAQKYWKDYREDLTRQIGWEKWSAEKSYFGSRLPWQVARIAALFHRINGGSSEVISLDSVYGARKLCDWYLSKFDDVFVAKDLRDAQKIREWIVPHHRKKFFESGDRFLSTVYSTRTLLQFGPVRGADDLSRAVKMLMECGDVIEDRLGPKGGGNFDFGPLLRGAGFVATKQTSHPLVRVTSVGDEKETPMKSDDFWG
ncbi:DUF3987 domain-containing protein [Burkholderia cenocepacia]|uniref:DUF3987 domain-containing protein n=1 Tax=Burkholderia cenocepacia TaxID=95486 RepID=UPI002AB5DE73|nr:DUF3987 domain-containing protein [Burkholderia cenocepacia]